MKPEVLLGLPDWLKAVATIQTILGLDAEAGSALPQCADAQVDDEAGHPARPAAG